MKKIGRMIGRIFHHIGLFFDKWLITPITRLIIRLMGLGSRLVKTFDNISGKKSTLLIVSLLLAFGVFIVIDQGSNAMIDQYAEILYNQPVNAVYNEELYVVEGLPKAVDITLIGQRRHIFLAKQSPSKGVSVDLTGLKPGNHKVTLKYTQRLKSLDYKLDPSQVTVTIYEKVSQNRSLTFDVLHQETLDKKLYISNVEIDRSDVIIKGAEYKLNKVATVKALVDVNSIPKSKMAAGDVTIKGVPLVAYDNDGKKVNVEIVPKTVTANITITSPSKEIPVTEPTITHIKFSMDEIRKSQFDISTKTVNGFVAIALQLNPKVQEMDLDDVIELEQKEYDNIIDELDNLELLADGSTIDLDDDTYLIYKLEKECHVTTSIPANEYTKKYYEAEMKRIDDAVLN